MVRHECAEALGAIGADLSRETLTDTMQKHPDRPELSDACRLALDVIDWRQNGSKQEETPPACTCMLNPFPR